MPTSHRSLNLAFLCLTLGQSLRKTVPITLNDFNHRKSLCWRIRYLHPRNHSFYTGKFQGRFCGNSHWHQMILTEYSIRQVGPQKLCGSRGDWYLYLSGRTGEEKGGNRKRRRLVWIRKQTEKILSYYSGMVLKEPFVPGLTGKSGISGNNFESCGNTHRTQGKVQINNQNRAISTSFEKCTVVLIDICECWS